MKLTFDHIGIACRDSTKALSLYKGALGLEVVLDTIVKHMNLHVVKLKAGETVLELLEPLQGEGVVSKFIESKGEGIHHICLKASEFDKSVSEMRNKGYKTIWPDPKMGASGKKVHFFHPKDTGGVLIEITE